MNLHKGLILYILLSLSGFAQAISPVINQYDAQISIDNNAQILITEKINVTVDGVQIKRGIYREIPTRYKTKQGYDLDIGLRIASIKKNDLPEPYHINKMSNGIRIYIGQSNVYLSPGTYTYEITYTVNQALGFFQDHDELYWNVTGNDWAYPIEHASAEVILPKGSKINRVLAFTGATGARGKSYSISYPDDNQVLFTTTTPIPPKNGFTIVVGWPKGIIAKPSLTNEISYFMDANSSLVIALGGFLFFLIFNYIAWHYLGRDPRYDTVIPLFEPPKGFSPQALRYINRMGYDNKTFTTAIINMAVKGYIVIQERGRNDYTLIQISTDKSKLTPPEQTIADELFRLSKKFIIEQENHEEISNAIRNFKRKLETEFRNKYFILNSPIVLFNFIITAASLFPLISEKMDLLGPLFFILFIAFLIFKSNIDTLSNYKSTGFSFKIIPPLFALIIFSGILYLIFSEQLNQGEWSTFGIVFLFLLSNMISIHLLKKPTQLGAKVINQTLGFERFLKATEEDRLNFRNPPNKTPELFEQYLPFALALDLEQAWSKQFDSILVQSQYQPTWYLGGNYALFSASNFSSSINSSLNSAITSSSVAPGSSSGFSGGSSGGGGGGGGGGGW